MAKGLLKKIRQSEESPKEADEFINSDEIIDSIKKGYEAQRSDQFKKRDSFTPSGLVYGPGLCPRYWYLYFEGNQANNNTDWYGVANMDSGSDRHKRIQTAMKHGKILIDDEVVIKSEDPPLSGKSDALIVWNDKEIITEIKTVNENSFMYMKKPRNYHIEQLLIYMKILNHSFGYLIYENKNSHELRFFPIRVNQKYKDFMKYFFDWMQRVRKSFVDKQLPENPYRNKYDNKTCKSCEFLKACEQKPVGDIKIESRKELE
ncbi:MAG: CRISPR-associated protein Cas4 [Sediminibacterium sp.]